MTASSLGQRHFEIRVIIFPDNEIDYDDLPSSVTAGELVKEATVKRFGLDVADDGLSQTSAASRTPCYTTHNRLVSANRREYTALKVRDIAKLTHKHNEPIEFRRKHILQASLLQSTSSN